MRKIGAHVSASGGLDKAVERAHAIGCNAVQVFSASPRVWHKPELSSYNTEAFFAAQKKLDVTPVVTHALYLINLASDNPASVEKSIKALTFELQFDSLVKGSGVVVHLGSHQGRGWEVVREQVVKAIAEILENTPDDSTFLIENSAGQNGKLCSDLSDIRWLIDQIKSSRLGWCFDTCHAFSSGYLLSEKSKTIYDKEMKKFSTVASNIADRVIADATIDTLDLWKTLKCIHVNDSRDPFASGKDRHENIGDGSIPTEDMKHFLNLRQVLDIPLMTEVPGLDGHGPDAENIKRLKALIH